MVRAEATRPVGGVSRRCLAFFLLALLLPALGGCAKQKTWCHPTFSKKTMESDLAFCRKKVEMFGKAHPDDVKACMQSLAWTQCDK